MILFSRYFLEDRLIALVRRSAQNITHNEDEEGGETFLKYINLLKTEILRR